MILLQSRSTTMAGIAFVFIFTLFVTYVDHVDAIHYSSEFTGESEFETSHDTCPERCTCVLLENDSLNVDCEYLELTQIPADIPRNTTELNLAENVLTELPANSFNGLSKLTHLTLSFNAISAMNVNTFTGLTDLNFLELSNNPNISSALVDFVFSPLIHLTELHLEACELTYINVKAFLNLTSLTTLYLQINQLTTFPDFVYQNSPMFPMLQSIDVDFNLLESISIKNLSKLMNVSIVNLLGNKIHDICSNNLSYSKSEDYVAKSIATNGVNVKKHHVHKSGLKNNRKLKNSYPASSGLKVLDLTQNKIKVLTANCFAALNSLENLTLDDNLITKIDALAFNKLSNLKFLSLFGNQVAVYEDRVFSPATSLEYCDLRSGIIKSLNVDAFLGLNYLSQLFIDFNHLTSIPQIGNDSSPRVLHNLKKLSLTYNKIDSLDESTQSVVHYAQTKVSNKLTELNLDGNHIEHLTPSNYCNLFPRLTKLTINACKVREIHPPTSWEPALLKRLELRGNPIEILHNGAFGTFSSLLYLDLSHCQMTKLNAMAFVNMSSLRDLRLDYNDFQDFPDFFDSNKIRILPNLTSLSMRKNACYLDKLTNVNRFTHLQRLTLSGNHFDIPIGVFENLHFLTHLYLIKCRLIVYKSSFKSGSLTHIVLDYSTSNLKHIDMFEELPNLKILQMANFYQILQSHDAYLTFRNMINLEHLDLSNTGIIPNSETFANSTHIKYLNLNDNHLRQLNRNIFKQMNNLESLMLSNTSLTSVNFTSLPEILWTRLREIDLSKNSYVCDCNIVWFRHWLKTTNVTILNSNNYKCGFPQNYTNKSIQSLPESIHMECFTKPFERMVYSVFILTFAVLFFSSLISLMHRFRWHVRYWQSIVTTRRRQYKELIDQRQYEYDAFVMYCQQDSQWVINELRPRLENIDNLRLCIHHRDWLGGRDIMDNITESIERSRKCLLIVSNAFAMSAWCHFELTMAQSRLFHEDRDNLVLVVLEEISECHLTPRLCLQMQRQTYIEWTDNVLGQQLFWAKLGTALKRPNQRVTNSPLPQSAFREIECDGE